MQRDKSIDFLKGFGIFLVVLGHLHPGMIIEKWIYSFHIFLILFCVCIGYLNILADFPFGLDILPTCLIFYYFGYILKRITISNTKTILY